jgi:sec-independent protein translocase protein TatA
MMRNFSVTEIALILLALVLLFGARRIPELARSLGRSLSEFKKGRQESLDDPAPNTDGDKNKSGGK